jgi:rod shape-determining protein MreC
MKVPTRHNSKRKNESRVARIVLLVSILIIFGMVFPFVMLAAAKMVLYPFHAIDTWYRTSSSRLPMYLKEQTELIATITQLENELATAASTDLTQQRLSEENRWLRGLLGGVEKKRIAAAVVARPDELPYDLLQIDRGSAHGIKVGAPVYIGADNVIGVISFVSEYSSFAQLFTTPGFSATAFISGPNIVTTLEGMGGGVARVSVPQGIPLTVGNLVHVPSIEPGVFGRVIYVENRPSQPEQYGFISLQTPISGIRYVAVASESVEKIDTAVFDVRVTEIIQDALNVDASKFLISSSTATSSQVGTTTETYEIPN